MLRDIIEGKCQQYGWERLALEIQSDHIHLFLSAKPNWNPSKIVNLLKGNTSRQLRLVFPHLRYLGYRHHIKEFSSLWASGYYCGTAGHVSQEQVVRYILEQERIDKFNYSILAKRSKQNLKRWLT